MDAPFPDDLLPSWQEYLASTKDVPGQDCYPGVFEHNTLFPLLNLPHRLVPLKHITLHLVPSIFVYVHHFA